MLAPPSELSSNLETASEEEEVLDSTYTSPPVEVLCNCNVFYSFQTFLLFCVVKFRTPPVLSLSIAASVDLLVLLSMAMEHPLF